MTVSRFFSQNTSALRWNKWIGTGCTWDCTWLLSIDYYYGINTHISAIWKTTLRIVPSILHEFKVVQVKRYALLFGFDNSASSTTGADLVIPLEQRHKQHTSRNRANIARLRDFVLFSFPRCTSWCFVHVLRVVFLFPLPFFADAAEKAPHSRQKWIIVLVRNGRWFLLTTNFNWDEDSDALLLVCKK